MVEVAGKFGRELAGQGEQAMVAFALEWLGSLYGAEIKRSVSKVYATRWNEQPFVLGAFSAASPGGQPSRAALMEPIRDRIWFAGEAVHETLWGTVGGAWLSGERAAESAMRRLGFITTPREPVAERPSRSRSSDRSRRSRGRGGAVEIFSRICASWRPRDTDSDGSCHEALPGAGRQVVGPTDDHVPTRSGA